MNTGDSGLLVVISGPSGAGKSTLCRRLFETHPEFSLSVSTTTRPPREGEVDGQHYHFVSRGEFVRQRDAGEFVEWAEVHDNFYGTSRRVIDDALAEGRSLVFDIDYQGAESMRSAYPDSVQIMLLPPNLEVLEERLRGRGTDAEDVVSRRLENAKGEIEACPDFDFVIVNDDLDTAWDELRAVLIAEGRRVARNRRILKRDFDIDHSR